MKTVEFLDGSEIVITEDGVGIISANPDVPITKQMAWPLFEKLTGVNVGDEK